MLFLPYKSTKIKILIECRLFNMCFLISAVIIVSKIRFQFYFGEVIDL